MRYPVILTDIEGTTSSIDFVKDVLFPYARERMGAFVREHAGEPAVRAQLDAAAREAGMDGACDEDIVGLLRRWIDEDRKATPLKALQGMIWEQGYAGSDFVAHVYPDALEALRRWHARGHRLYVYSSGSVQAQKLFFAHTAGGDLSPLFSGYFDTTMGAKREPDSYVRIAAAIGEPASRIVFLSDIEAELDAAAAAGMATRWVRRDAIAPKREGAGHVIVSAFDELDF